MEDQSKPEQPLYLQTIIAAYRQKPKLDIGSGIKVSQALSTLAHIYEKIRCAIDYRGEHLFRRVAIERILRRLLNRRNIDTRNVALKLIKELIWSHYLINEKVPLEKINQVSEILNKYLSIQESLFALNHIFDKKFELMVAIMANEIDEALVDQSVDEAWAVGLSQWFENKYDWIDEINHDVKRILLYIAVRRAFFKSDAACIYYHLLIKNVVGWQEGNSAKYPELVIKFKQSLASTEKYLNNRFNNDLFRFIQKKLPAFQVFKDIFDQQFEGSEVLINDEQLLWEKVEAICIQKYRQTNKKVRQGIINSIIYIFATKMVFAILLEVPYETIRLGRISWLPLSINLVFPPFLMFLIGLLIHTPGADNTKIIYQTILSFIDPKTTDRHAFSLEDKTNHRPNLIFKTVYLLILLTVFCSVTYVLWQIGFNVISGMIFFFFVSLVLLFGLRVRWAAQELKVIGDKENLFQFLFNLVSLPFLDLGNRLTVGLTRLNVMMIILDFLIEAPLKIIISVIGQWTTFIQQKRDEMIEVPY